jgi:hypothetical protein
MDQDRRSIQSGSQSSKGYEESRDLVMRVTTRVRFDRNYNVIEEDTYDYVGPVDACKKGREDVENAAKTQGQLASTAQGWATDNRNATTPFAKSLIPGGNGDLSPYVKAQLDKQKSDIAKTYGDIAQTGMKAATARGFGSAPSGNIASIYNTAGRNAGEAERSAYADAQDKTATLGLQGINYLDPNKPLSEATGASTAQANSGALRNKMGSGFSDVLGGLSGIVGLGRRAFGLDKPANTTGPSWT